MSNRRYIFIVLLGIIIIVTLLSVNELFYGHENIQGETVINDPIMYIYAPVTKESGYVSFSAGNYNGMPVVVYKASTLYIPEGQVIIGIGPSYNITMSMGGATVQNIIVYAANITATVTVLGINETVTITPQNVGVLSIISEIVSMLLPLYNVRMYAYYVNASSITYTSIEMNA